jgi:hypothetical protein
MSRNSIIIFLFLILLVPVFPQDVKVISSDKSSIILEYLPDYKTPEVISINNKDYIKINIFSAGYNEASPAGSPLIPFKVLNIGVPSEFGNTIEVLSSTYKIIQGNLAPVPLYSPDGILNKFVYAISEDYYSSETEIVNFGEFAISRGLPLQSIVFSPVQFNSELSEIKLYERIVVRVNYSSQQGSVSIKDDFDADAVINFNEAKLWNDAATLKKGSSVTNSVLAQGTWFRFETEEEGFYKITRSMLPAYGIDPNTVDPRTIKIYNNGGKALPERVTTAVPTDLVENSIIVFGENNGKFDEGDYILFYGRGTHFWEFDSLSNSFKRYFHPYSAKNYFWITSGGSPGKRMHNKQSHSGSIEYIQTSTRAFAQLEEEKINLPKSGRNFFGDEFNSRQKSRTYMNTLSGIIPESKINYKFAFANSDLNKVPLIIEENSTTIYSNLIDGTSLYGNYSKYATGRLTTGIASFTGTLPSDRSLLKFTFNINNVSSSGFLDFFEIQYNKYLTAYNDQLLFFSHDTSAVIEYHLNGFSNSNFSIYDITDHSNVELISNHFVSGGEAKFASMEQTRSVSKYFALGNNNFLTPANPVQMPNSNYHGISEGADLIIITDKAFREAAEKLKHYRENDSYIKYRTLIFEVDKIFNEFSGGLTDVSGLRNFIKYAYENWNITPQYVLLFGDGTFDYKNIEGKGGNFVLTWQSVESLYQLNSFTTDDFFVRVDGDDSVPDIAIGRLPLNSLQDAYNVVNKIIHYENNSDLGNWRNIFTLVSDDALTSDSTFEGNMHTRPHEEISNNVNYQSYDFNKIYLGAYPVVITSGGRRKPAVNEDIIKSMNGGTKIVSYVGHGNPDLWAHEVVFDKNTSIPKLNNLNRLFFLLAATCDFSDFDKIGVQSGAEELLTKSNGGSIGSFASARLVFSLSNEILLKDIVSNLLDSRRDTLSLPKPIGKVSYYAKKLNFDQNSQKYVLLGDPTLRLLLPRYKANVDSINNLPLTPPVQVKALSSTGIEGTILNQDDLPWSSYNGEGILTMYDSERKINLEQLGNYDVIYPGGIIFRGRVSVNNGSFKTNFVVPKDISYENKNGKIVFYFFNDDGDGIAATRNIIVGGTDTSIVNDGKGPEIEIYFDDPVHKNATLANPNSTLIIELKDETGINTTGTGIGHKLEGILNNDETNPIDFTNYFTGDLDSGGKSGKVNYQLSNFFSGEYKLEVKAWDVFNNFSKETKYFTIVTGDDLTIRDVFNYPNPFSSNTTFMFQHNLNTQVFDVNINIYTVAGRLIKKIERYNLNERYVTIDWDGRDEDGNQIANGAYFYKVAVKTIDGSESKSIIGKMAVIR